MHIYSPTKRRTNSISQHGIAACVFPGKEITYSLYLEAPKLVRQSLFQQIEQKSNIFHCKFNPFALCTPCTGHNTDLTSSSNISKAVRVNIVFTIVLISFLMICRLKDPAHVVLQLLIFKVCGIIGISKIEFFNFSDTERVNMPR